MKNRILAYDKVTGAYASGWTFNHTQAWCVGAGPLSGRVEGWSLHSPDGVERFCKGDWARFVPFARTVFENHGLRALIS